MKKKKNVIKSKVIFFLVLFLVSNCLSGCSSEEVKGSNESVSDKLDEYITAFNEVCTESKYMGSVLIEKDGEVVFHESYGMSDSENNMPNEVNSVFKIASISKTITATAILQLHEKGLLDIKDPISKYIPLKDKANKITIENLLNHTSGLSPSGYFEEKKALANEDVNLLVESEPGVRFVYSNIGYRLLAYIIEVVSDMSYEDYLRENIFKPLNMTNTGCENSNNDIHSLALPHILVSGDIERTDDSDTSQLIGSGNIYSTAFDLNLFFRALDNGELLKQETLTLMRSVNTKITPNYGYGLQILEFKGKKYYGHVGVLPGAYSLAMRLPADNVTVILLFNINFTNPIHEMACVLTAIALGEDYNLPANGEEINLSNEELDKYKGKYRFLGTNSNVTVTINSKNYLEFRTLYTPIDLIPYSRSEFIMKGFETNRVIFTFDDNGNVEGLIIEDTFKDTLECEKID